MSRRKQICSFLWKVWDIMKVRRRRVPSFKLPSARRISGSNASLTSVSHRQCHTAKRLRKEKLCRTAFDWHCLTQSFSEVKLRDERSEDIHKGVRETLGRRSGSTKTLRRFTVAFPSIAQWLPSWNVPPASARRGPLGSPLLPMPSWWQDRSKRGACPLA